MNLLTRRQVIEIWNKQKDEFLDSYVCPNCRDILTKHEDGIYECENPNCLEQLIPLFEE